MSKKAYEKKPSINTVWMRINHLISLFETLSVIIILLLFFSSAYIFFSVRNSVKNVAKIPGIIASKNTPL